MRIVAIVVTLSILAIPSQAEWEHLSLSGDVSGQDCTAYGRGVGLLPIYVVHRGTHGASGSRFRVNFSDCLNSPTILGFNSNYDVEGDLETGVTIDYGECMTTDHVVLTINLFLNGPADDCCDVYLLPHGNSSSRKAESVDCTMNPNDVEAGVLIVNSTSSSGCTCELHCNNMLPWVEDPYPPDGSNGVELNSRLTWDTIDPETVPTEHRIYFGTNPTPPMVLDRFNDYSYDPGPLLSNTTYYWTVGVWTYCGASLVGGPVWQFTTKEGVPVETTTWGRIKSLYVAPD